MDDTTPTQGAAALAERERVWTNAVLELIARHFPAVPISDEGDDSRARFKRFALDVASIAAPPVAGEPLTDDVIADVWNGLRVPPDSSEWEKTAAFGRAIAAMASPAPEEPTNERMADALHRIKQWSEAYPLTAFPEPDLKRAHEVLTAAGMTLDAISARAMRHVTTRVQAIADAALAGVPVVLPQSVSHTNDDLCPACTNTAPPGNPGGVEGSGGNG